ncbi:MAG: SCO family protein [Aggregatilineales bacterium]|nr:SCO family protein [Aggregatilineales bacterium]HPV05485.1 SCO family protein [Aggregatilineales bacterium]
MSEAPGRDAPRWVFPAVLGSVILLLGLVPLLVNAFAPHPVGEVYLEPRQIEDFELQMAEGGTFRLSDYRGKTLVFYFGYTTCPDVCPTTLYDFKRAKAELGEWEDEVQFVFVTVDPAVDTAEQIDQYLAHFDEDFIGLYGTEEELKRVADQFGVKVVSADKTAGYGITHTTSSYIVDANGLLKIRMHYGQKIDRIANDIRLVAKGRI